MSEIGEGKEGKYNCGGGQTSQSAASKGITASWRCLQLYLNLPSAVNDSTGHHTLFYFIPDHPCLLALFMFRPWGESGTNLWNFKTLEKKIGQNRVSPAPYLWN